MSARRDRLARLAQVQAWLVRLWRHRLGHAVWAVAAVVAFLRAAPGEPRHILPAVALGALVGLRAGKVWRDRLRDERDGSGQHIAAWNSSAAREDLADPAVTPVRKPVRQYDWAAAGAYEARMG